jgi:NAD(P)-dependent dehydrogenase (short-subunit alcohol dehydrogenase family)
MPGLLDGGIAFVTGGAQGIGLEVARRFAAEAARVMIGDVRGEVAEKEAHRLRVEGLDVAAVTLDVTDPKSVEQAAAECERVFGAADILVANAGILHLADVLELSLEQWQRVLDVNLTGVFLTCRAFARCMLDARRGGRIIVTSSLFGRRGGRQNGAYSASKFGVIGLVESLAAELAPKGILVNAVCPGQVDTEMIRQLIRDRAATQGIEAQAVESDLVADIPLGRMARPDEVADVYVYLASPLSRYVTGQSLVVDGGMQVG